MKIDLNVLSYQARVSILKIQEIGLEVKWQTYGTSRLIQYTVMDPKTGNCWVERQTVRMIEQFANGITACQKLNAK